MLSDRAKDALDGIRINLQAIADFIGNMTFEQFAADKLTFYAVTPALEIISEASRRLPDDFKERYPRIRWRSIRDAGNVYRHGYAQVSEAEVWDTAASQLDELRALVSREFGEHAPGTGNVPPDRSGKEESDS